MTSQEDGMEGMEIVEQVGIWATELNGVQLVALAIAAPITIVTAFRGWARIGSGRAATRRRLEKHQRRV